MTATDAAIGFAGAQGLAERIAAGELTSVEAVESSLRQIEATQETLNAFRCFRPAEAIAEAAEADRRRAEGERLPLLGVPIAIKDDVDMAGEATAFGCPGEHPPKEEDSELVRRLRAAGAVIVGKTNTPELGQWPFTESSSFGATRNPWSLEHSPAGSSGGAAAAVAAGLVPAAIGSDGAGSVRIPAAWTNLVGLKPQRGRISTWPDPEAFNGLTVLGPLTRTVADAALLLDALAGNVEGDLHRPPPPDEPFAALAARDPGRLRIGLALNIPYSGAPARLEPEVREAVEGVAETLERLGHDVEPVKAPYGLAPGAGFMPRSMAGIADWVERIPVKEGLDPRTVGNAKVGRILRPLLPLARGLERVARWRLGRLFEDYDVVLTPTTAKPPQPIGYCEGLGGWQTDRAIVAACPYAWPWNVIGWPALSVPAGFTDDGLPLGAQLLGPANAEGLLLAVGSQLEEELRWHERRPPSHIADRP